MIDQVTTTLREAGYSLTKPRLTVFGALQAPKPKTMRELVTELDGVIDRASVYRTVSLFERLGIVIRVQHGWKYRLELSDEFTPHHHHITCTSCLRVVSFDEPRQLEGILQTVSLTHKFTVASHNLELFGLCPQCRIKPTT